CRVTVSLLFSTDSGLTYQPAPAGGGLPARYGTDGGCGYPGVATSSLTYGVPLFFPSGVSGSLYKIQITVADEAGNESTVTSANPFYSVQPNPDSVRTLILAHTERMRSQMEISTDDQAALERKLQELAANPKVLGQVVDLNNLTDVNELYGAWDADP